MMSDEKLKTFNEKNQGSLTPKVPEKERERYSKNKFTNQFGQRNGRDIVVLDSIYDK